MNNWVDLLYGVALLLVMYDNYVQSGRIYKLIDRVTDLEIREMERDDAQEQENNVV